MDMLSGLFEFDHSYIHLSLRFDHNDNHNDDNNNDNDITFSHYELIIAEHSNINNGNGNNRMFVYNAKSVKSELIEMACSGMRENVIIDLNFGGRRWEGGELNGKPFGFGYEYSEDDNLVYEGFMYEGMKVCYGKEWNDDGNNNCLIYEGGYCNGERCGKGKSYDLTGNISFEGEWDNNHGMIGDEMKLNLYSLLCIEEFVINNRMNINDDDITTLHFSPLLLQLKRIEIEDCFFSSVREFVLDGLPNLENVKIGNCCFISSEDENTAEGLFRITNCPNLLQLEIGRDSFQYYHSFELSNNNSIQSILIGETCFLKAIEFSLKSKLCKLI